LLPSLTVTDGPDGVSVSCTAVRLLRGVLALEVYEMVHEELERRGIAPLHSV
jgi:hypothetical protein